MNLTDLNSVKVFLSKTAATSGQTMTAQAQSALDASLAPLIPQESQSFLSEISRDGLESATYTEYFDGRNRYKIVLRNPPVTSIATLTVGNQPPLPAYVFPQTWGYTFSPAGLVRMVGKTLWGGPDQVQVVYAGGYLPVTVTNELATIPATPGPYNLFPFNPNWRSDLGVKYFSGGAPLTPVAGSPGPGQYYVVPLGQIYAGQYQFNAADQGAQVQISYTYAGIPADVNEAVNEMVLLRYYQRNTGGVDSITAGTVTTKYVLAAYSKHAERVMNNYRRGIFRGMAATR